MDDGADRDGGLQMLLGWLMRGGEGAALRPDPDLRAWWRAFQEVPRKWPLSVDQAIVGGFQADRVGYAFAAGYQSALRCLAPSLPADRLVSLSITEEGGGHPRAIKTTLRAAGTEGPAARGWRLCGHKKWATLSCDGDVVLVAASTGTDAEGRNELRMALVPLDARGVTVHQMPGTSFAPEITHGELTFDDVCVPPEAVLPGDGYTRYVRPFRTIEDTHVSAAILGHVLGVAVVFGWPRPLREDLLNLAVNLRAIASGDPSAPEIHVALGGFFNAYRTVLERAQPCWQGVSGDVRARWARDRPLLDIAGNARAKRLEAAWRRVLP
jgi:hypothetical protein